MTIDDLIAQMLDELTDEYERVIAQRDRLARAIEDHRGACQEHLCAPMRHDRALWREIDTRGRG